MDLYKELLLRGKDYNKRSQYHFYTKARITKLFRSRFSKTLFLVECLKIHT